MYYYKAPSSVFFAFLKNLLNFLFLYQDLLIGMFAWFLFSKLPNSWVFTSFSLRSNVFVTSYFHTYFFPSLNFHLWTRTISFIQIDSVDFLRIDFTILNSRDSLMFLIWDFILFRKSYISCSHCWIKFWNFMKYHHVVYHFHKLFCWRIFHRVWIVYQDIHKPKDSSKGSLSLHNKSQLHSLSFILALLANQIQRVPEFTPTLSASKWHLAFQLLLIGQTDSTSRSVRFFSVRS